MAAGGSGTFKKSQYPIAADEEAKCERFLSDFFDFETNTKKYREQLQKIADMQATTLTIYLDDIEKVRPTQAHTGEAAAAHVRRARKETLRVCV